MNVKNAEQTLRHLFNGLKRDKVVSALVYQSDWGINIRTPLNGDIFESNLINKLGGYELSFVGCEDTPPMQIDELLKLTQPLQLCQGKAPCIVCVQLD